MLSLPGKMPDDVVLLSDVINDCPERYINASLLDVLTNLTAVHDWKFYSDTYKSSDEIASILAETSALYALETVTQDKQEKIEIAINCQISSGISMLFAGSSQPCSGSEHMYKTPAFRKNRIPTELGRAPRLVVGFVS